MSVSDYEGIMRQAQNMHVLQVALGGGNPNQHPDFCQILKLTREKYGIVPSYTTNGRGLTEEVLGASREYCGAVAVSAYSPYEEMTKAINTLTAQGIRTNVHFVVTSRSIDTALGWLGAPPEFLSRVNAVVFLNYKPIGRCSDRALLLRNSDALARFFRIATRQRRNFRVGFDSCLVSGLARYADVSEVVYDGCDAGRFSMFISENLEMFPCSFMVADYDGTPVKGNNMLETWQKGKVFTQIRRTLASGRCQSCAHMRVCRGGCPILSEINLCPAKDRADYTGRLVARMVSHSTQWTKPAPLGREAGRVQF